MLSVLLEVVLILDKSDISIIFAQSCVKGNMSPDRIIPFIYSLFLPLVHLLPSLEQVRWVLVPFLCLEICFQLAFVNGIFGKIKLQLIIPFFKYKTFVALDTTKLLVAKLFTIEALQSRNIDDREPACLVPSPNTVSLLHLLFSMVVLSSGYPLHSHLIHVPEMSKHLPLLERKRKRMNIYLYVNRDASAHQLESRLIQY